MKILNSKSRPLNKIEYPNARIREVKRTMSNPVLCIPRIESHISKEYIRTIFSKLKIGEIQKITEVPLRNDSDYKRIFIKLVWQPNTPTAEYIHTRLVKGEDIKLVYNEPWYWKVVSCK